MAKTKKIVASHDEELDVEFQEETHIYLNTHESINQRSSSVSILIQLGRFDSLDV